MRFDLSISVRTDTQAHEVLLCFRSTIALTKQLGSEQHSEIDPYRAHTNNEVFMVTIKPFRALRPASDLAAQVAALPYDVYSLEESRALTEANPLSFLAIDEPAVHFPVGHATNTPDVYDKAAEVLNQQKSAGVYVRDEAAQFYLYELTMDGRVQNGLVCCASLADHIDGLIKEHESTRIDKEIDRTRHVEACQAHTGPIYLAYRKHAELAQLWERIKNECPLFDFTAEDGIRHRGFSVADPDDIAFVESTFAQRVDCLYVADGHHRLAAAARLARKLHAADPAHDGIQEYDYFLAVAFADDELAILDYNRVLKNLKGMTPLQFLEKLGNSFDIAPIEADLSIMHAQDRVAAEASVRPRAKGTFSLFLDGRWYRLRLHDNLHRTDPIGTLDVSAIQDYVLRPLLGIVDPRTDPRIDFVGGIRGLGELERRCGEDCVAAFALYPTSIEELFAVADAGMLMPPKSTWFEPKLRSGLFIHEF